MGQLFGYITSFFAFIINFIYGYVNNYGIAIIIFTVIVKILMLPFTIKQQKSMDETKKIQPLIKELQNKYKNDKDALNTALMDLYKEHNVNPAAGCLPLLIQLPIIIALYQVISRPLTYMMTLISDSGDVIAQIKTALELDVAKPISEIALLSEIAQKGSGFIESLGIYGYKYINFNFLELDLSQTPSFSTPSWLWVIPILAALTSWISIKQTQPPAESTNKDDQAAQASQTSAAMMPLFSGWIAFTLPAGVGLYWVTSYVVQIIQHYLLNKIWSKNTPVFPKKDIITAKKIEPSEDDKKKDNKNASKKKK